MWIQQAGDNAYTGEEDRQEGYDGRPGGCQGEHSGPQEPARYGPQALARAPGVRLLRC